MGELSLLWEFACVGFAASVSERWMNGCIDSFNVDTFRSMNQRASHQQYEWVKCFLFPSPRTPFQRPTRHLCVQHSEPFNAPLLKDYIFRAKIKDQTRSFTKHFTSFLHGVRCMKTGSNAISWNPSQVYYHTLLSFFVYSSDHEQCTVSCGYSTLTSESVHD